MTAASSSPPPGRRRRSRCPRPCRRAARRPGRARGRCARSRRSRRRCARSSRIVADELGRLGVGEAGSDLVEQQHLRVGRERAGELEPLAVQQAERSRPAGSRAPSARTARAPRRPAVRIAAGRAAAAGRRARRDVLEHGHAAERLRHLVRAARCRAGSARAAPAAVTSAPRNSDRARRRAAASPRRRSAASSSRRRWGRRCPPPRRPRRAKSHAVQHDERAEPLPQSGRRRAAPCRHAPSINRCTASASPGSERSGRRSAVVEGERERVWCGSGLHRRQRTAIAHPMQAFVPRVVHAQQRPGCRRPVRAGAGRAGRAIVDVVRDRRR